jgi:hypothetical protein
MSTPTIVRYCRFLSVPKLEPWNIEISNLGGITFAFNIDHDAKELSVGFSVCSNKENFVKEVGREISLRRLSESPLKISYNLNLSLVDNVENYLATKMSKAEINSNRQLKTLYDNLFE